MINNCEGNGPCSEGEVRLLPVSNDPHHGNTILCRSCFRETIRWRMDRNKTLSKDTMFSLPTWDRLRVYEEVTA